MDLVTMVFLKRANFRKLGILIRKFKLPQRPGTRKLKLFGIYLDQSYSNQSGMCMTSKLQASLL